MTSTRSKWEKFFKDAGIPIKPASEYATKFCDNRMRHDMLEELNKEVLHELGVKAIGDVIAILRHAKAMQAEISRQESSMQSDVEITGTSHPPKKTEKPTKQAVPTIATTNADQKQLKNLSMTVKADLKTSSKIKPPRRTLSDRFCEYEKESKKKKDEEKKESPPTSKETAAKSKPTVFTIQLPSKPPPITDSPPNMPPSVMKNTGKKETKEKPVKVTLVPAQGKPLNRNKQSTSIFDRLDKASSGKSKTSTTFTKTIPVTPKDTKDIFSRLGDIDKDNEHSSSYSSKSTSNKGRESTVISPLNQSIDSSSSSSKNVFSRLGDL